jgi:type VI secretion system Hcp family effector
MKTQSECGCKISWFRTLVTCSVLFPGLFACLCFGQNIGIGTSNPTEKLEVDGKVFSSSEGFKFPDGSIQTRAYNAYETQDAAEGRLFVVMDIPGIDGSFSFGGHNNDIKVISLDWGVYFNVTEVLNGPPGQCHFKLLTVTKEIDKASPNLLLFWLNGGPALAPVLYFYKADSTEYYKMTLSGVQIVKLNENVIYNGNNYYAHVEEVVFTYDDIKLTWYGPPQIEHHAGLINCMTK